MPIYGRILKQQALFSEEKNKTNNSFWQNLQNSPDFDLLYVASYYLMKQKEYDQWNDPLKFYSDGYFLPI